MRKVIERSDGRTEMTVDTVNSEEKLKKALIYGKILGIVAPIFLLKKASLPKNTLFYINQVYQSFKDGKKILS